MSNAKPWTGREIRKLKEIFPMRSNEDVARIIGRGVYAITKKANRLGLVKSELYIRDLNKRKGRKPKNKVEVPEKVCKTKAANNTEQKEYSDLDRLLMEIRKSNNDINYKVQF